jgi:ElaB/YqjD/DUF883 family membrane-anchored ribosome-binding protein
VELFTPHSTRDKLAADLKQVMTSAEELLSATAHHSDEAITTARAKAEATIRQAKDKLLGLEHTVADQAKHAVEDGTQQIKAHPWAAVGVGAGVGLLLGLLIARR